MRIDEAKAIVRTLMDEHGLSQWKLILIDSKSMAGWCRTMIWTPKPERSFGTIALSRDFMTVFDHKEVHETGLHEIAHALNDPKNKAHGSEWKVIARRIGSTGERCVAVEAPRPASRYVGTCPQDHKYARHRKSWDMEMQSRYCPKCWNQYKEKNRAYITWFDTHTNRTLNSVTPVMPKTLDTSAPVRIAAQRVSTPVRRTVPTPAKELSWKEKFDRGMTSFDEEW